MATVINNSGTPEISNSTGVLIAIVLFIILVMLLYFGTPYVNSMNRQEETSGNSTTQEQPPVEGGTNINIPDKIEVKVQEGEAE